ncbi:hypothetical protein GCM10025858_21930 [Alicyclobacillus sacchari]|nr:hypothetical protein GCM10025858_21930 [Alicyclobacillus sacchari]
MFCRRFGKRDGKWARRVCHLRLGLNQRLEHVRVDELHIGQAVDVHNPASFVRQGDEWPKDDVGRVLQLVAK